MLPQLSLTHNLVNEKVDAFTDSMIEDIQDIIKVEIGDDDVSFTHGVLPPRYKELKEEMKLIISRYIVENMQFSWMTNLEQHME